MILKNRKILIFDYGNLSKRLAFSGHVKESEHVIDYQIFNYSIGNSIFAACNKHKPTTVILANDNKSWRNIVYAPYKRTRRLQAQKENELGIPHIDGEEFYENLNKFSYKLRTNLPIVYLTEKQCEADDIIGIICREYSSDNEIVIISGDSDYTQCLKHENVSLGNPGGFNVKPHFVKAECDPNEGITVMSLCGQPKDNIYNVFTRLDFPVEFNVMRESVDIKPIRKPQLTEKQAGEILRSGDVENGLNVIGPEIARKKNLQIEKENKKLLDEGLQPRALYEENVSERFKLNKKIISFDEIPQVLVKRIVQQIDEYELPKDTDFYIFFKKMKWNEPLDNGSRTEKILFNLY